MPSQNLDSSAADPASPDERARRAPHSYAAPDVADSTLAPPAAGEVTDYMDEGDALGADDVQSGSDHRNRPERTQAMTGQGRKTLAGNRERFRSGSADGR